ncbi:MAG: excisionase family DNA-binding protein [Mariprofundaceae bacterium]|nr:excisionase family DNA-binding protein [Mariprofundaceae bacterium]
MKEICKHLGVSNDTVYKWINRYGMPAYRLGRRPGGRPVRRLVP